MAEQMHSTHTSRVPGPGFGKTIAAIRERSPLDLETAARRIAEMGGGAERARRNRSLYPYFFSAREAAGIANRLRALD